MANLSARVRICREPSGVNVIRLDRFSRTSTKRDKLGFTRLRPLPFYEFLLRPARVGALQPRLLFRLRLQGAAGRHALRRSARSQRPRVEDHLEAHRARVGRSRRSPVRVRHQAARQVARYRCWPARIASLFLACDAITDSSALDASSVERLRAIAGATAHAERRGEVSVAGGTGRRLSAVAATR